MKVVLELIGHYAGKTVTLSGLEYKEGLARISGDPTAIAPLMNYHQKCYQAYVQGSEELEEAKADLEMAKQVQAKEKELEDERSEDLLDGSGDESGHSDGANIEPTYIDDHGGDNDTEPSGEEPVSEGDGSPEGDSGEPTPEEKSDPVLLKAVQSLDPTNDDFWTPTGLPKLKAVEEAAGKTGFTRVDVDATEWTRKKAEEIASL